jgi:hypothetical protein
LFPVFILISGLRYDDLYDDMQDLDVKEALSRLPQSVVDARNQRLKRAMDLSLKHSHLPEDLQVLPSSALLRILKASIAIFWFSS